MSPATARVAAAPAPSTLPRLLAGIHADAAVSLDEHIALHGPLPPGLWRHGPGLVERLERSGLHGRGGGAFPTGEKLRAVAAQRRRPVVVANALEGEPASGKDKALLRHVPQLVLDGAVAVAAALGAREALIAVCQDAEAEQRAVAAAISARERAGCDGGVRLSLALVPGGFVSGEETALVHALNGGPSKPTLRPPLPFERGVDGAPTLVQNAETLAQIALIARHGSAWFRSVGTPAEPGSTLVTVSGAVRNPGVFEVALGTPLAGVLARAGGLSEQPRAFLVGGYFGTWITAEAAEAAALSNAGLARAGARLGAGAIVALPASSCGLAETARVARYLANESAGQCGPCVYGLAAIADWLEQIESARGSGRGGPAAEPELARVLGLVSGRGACRHPDGAVRFVRSALATFAEEVDDHLGGRRCAQRGVPVLPVLQRRRS